MLHAAVHLNSFRLVSGIDVCMSKGISIYVWLYVAVCVSPHVHAIQMESVRKSTDASGLLGKRGASIISRAISYLIARKQYL